MFAKIFVAVVTLGAMLNIQSAPVDAQHLRSLQVSKNWMNEMLQAVNAERAKEGKPPYCLNKKLNAAAQAHSEDMAQRDSIGHTGSDGSSYDDRFKRAGFHMQDLTKGSENVASGQTDVQSAMSAWLRSPGHRRSIMGPYKYLGLGVATSSGGRLYWTQTFGTADNEQCMSACKPKY